MTPKRGPTFHLREIKPKDFYLAQILRQKEEGYVSIILRLCLNSEVLDESPITESRAVFKWIGENILDKNILTVENWLEVCYHLCKQRWDSSIDWLEEQPMSKIQTMIEIQKNHAEEQEKEMKKASRRKK